LACRLEFFLLFMDAVFSKIRAVVARFLQILRPKWQIEGY
jgi:hypothetical protein